jgi:hypothetical protein
MNGLMTGAYGPANERPVWIIRATDCTSAAERMPVGQDYRAAFANLLLEGIFLWRIEPLSYTLLQSCNFGDVLISVANFTLRD